MQSIKYVVKISTWPRQYKTSKSLTCGQCDMTFDTTPELAEHNRKEHTIA